MNILLIWEIIPEETKIYRFIELEEDVAQKIIQCNGKFLGLEYDDDADIDRLNWLSDILVSCTHEDETDPIRLTGDWTVVVSGQVL